MFWDFQRSNSKSMDLMFLSKVSEGGERSRWWKWNLDGLPLPPQGALPAAEWGLRMEMLNLLSQEDLVFPPHPVLYSQSPAACGTTHSDPRQGFQRPAGCWGKAGLVCGLWVRAQGTQTDRGQNWLPDTQWKWRIRVRGPQEGGRSGGRTSKTEPLWDGKPKAQTLLQNFVLKWEEDP